jgi:hypothetical protein
MDNKGHTPGPWHVEDGALTKGNEEPTGWFVCHPKTECDATALVWVQRKEDAILIAAAPDLLAAANEAFDFLGGVDGAAEVRGKLLAALSRATEGGA